MLLLSIVVTLSNYDINLVSIFNVYLILQSLSVPYYSKVLPILDIYFFSSFFSSTIINQATGHCVYMCVYLHVCACRLLYIFFRILGL